MARRPARSKPKDTAPATSSQFLDAMKFIGLACKNEGPPNETHCLIDNQWAVGFNGIVAAGHQVIEDLSAAPHAFRFIDALERCKDQYSITQLDANRLSIRTERFRAIVPCIDAHTWPQITPDPPCAVIDDRLKWALETVGVLALDTAMHVIEASVLLRSGSVLATDRHTMFEAWHGIDLPPGIVLPKAAVTILAKRAEKLTQFGFSPSSVTFYFENGSWIRTQLYSEQWPDVSRLLDVATNAWPVPVDLFEGIKAILPFTEDGCIRFAKDQLLTHDDPNNGATYTVPGLPAGPLFNAKRLLQIEPYCKTIDFFGPRNEVAYFFGDNIRGAVVGSSK